MSKSAADIEREIRESLGTCPLDARGLWHEMRHLVETQSDRDGYLQRNGRPLSDAQLALAAGCPSDAVAPLLSVLSSAGLVERVRECWVCPSLARLADVRRRAAGRTAKWRSGKGDGASRDTPSKPRVSRDAPCDAGVTPTVTPGVTADPPPPPPLRVLPLKPPLTSSPPPPPPVLGAGPGRADGEGRTGGAATAGLRGTPVTPVERTRRGVVIPPELATPAFLAAWRDWETHLRQKRVSRTPLADEQQVRQCVEWGEAWAVDVIRHSIAGSYQGLFPPPAAKGNGRPAAGSGQTAIEAKRAAFKAALERRSNDVRQGDRADDAGLGAVAEPDRGPGGGGARHDPAA